MEVTTAKQGRPKRAKNKAQPETETAVGERHDGSLVHCRQEQSKTVEETPSTSKSSATTHKSSNRNIYLVQHTSDKFAYSKLPKNSHVLRRFLLEMQPPGTIKAAAAKTAQELRNVDTFHLGLRLIMGKSTSEDKREDESMKLIIMTSKIEKKIANLYQEWKDLEKTSRRKDRSMNESFRKKEKDFEQKLELPMNIAKSNPKEILRKSKVIDWKDELTHLRQQLIKKQMGCAMGYDKRQEERDKAKR